MDTETARSFQVTAAQKPQRRSVGDTEESEEKSEKKDNKKKACDESSSDDDDDPLSALDEVKTDDAEDEITTSDKSENPDDDDDDDEKYRKYFDCLASTPTKEKPDEKPATPVNNKTENTLPFLNGRLSISARFLSRSLLTSTRANSQQSMEVLGEEYDAEKTRTASLEEHKLEIQRRKEEMARAVDANRKRLSALRKAKEERELRTVSPPHDPSSVAITLMTTPRRISLELDPKPHLLHQPFSSTIQPISSYDQTSKTTSISTNTTTIAKTLETTSSLIPLTQLGSRGHEEPLGKDTKTESMPDFSGTGQNLSIENHLPVSRSIASTNLFETFLSTLSVTQTNKDQLIPEKDDNVRIKRNVPDLKREENEGPAPNLRGLVNKLKPSRTTDVDEAIKSTQVVSGSAIIKEKQKEFAEEKLNPKDQREKVLKQIEMEKIGNGEIQNENGKDIQREQPSQKNEEKDEEKEKDKEKKKPKGKCKENEKEKIEEKENEREKENVIVNDEPKERMKHKQRQREREFEKEKERKMENEKEKEKEEKKENPKDKKEKGKAESSVVGKLEKRGSSSSLMAQTKSSWRKSLGFTGFSSKHKDKKDDRQGSTPFTSTLRSFDQPVKRSEKILFRDKKSKVSTEDRRSKSKSLGDLDSRLKPLREELILDSTAPPSHVVSTADIPRELSTQARSPSNSPLTNTRLSSNYASRHPPPSPQSPPFTDRRSPIGKDRGKTSFYRTLDNIIRITRVVFALLLPESTDEKTSSRLQMYQDAIKQLKEAFKSFNDLHTQVLEDDSCEDKDHILSLITNTYSDMEEQCKRQRIQTHQASTNPTKSLNANFSYSTSNIDRLRPSEPTVKMSRYASEACVASAVDEQEDASRDLLMRYSDILVEMVKQKLNN